MPTIAEYLKYANLQMAAEAFIRNPDTGAFSPTGDDLANALQAGNKRGLLFTATQAAEFAGQWTE